MTAFGRRADELASVRKGDFKGDLLHVCGRLDRRRYQSRAGGEREAWAVVADAIVTARPASSRGKRRGNGNGRGAGQPDDAPELTDDDIPSPARALRVHAGPRYLCLSCRRAERERPPQLRQEG